MASNRRGFLKIIGGAGVAVAGYAATVFPELGTVSYAANNRGTRELSSRELDQIVSQAQRSAEFEAIRHAMPSAGFSDQPNLQRIAGVTSANGKIAYITFLPTDGSRDSGVIKVYQANSQSAPVYTGSAWRRVGDPGKMSASPTAAELMNSVRVERIGPAKRAAHAVGLANAGTTALAGCE